MSQLVIPNSIGGVATSQPINDNFSAIATAFNGGVGTSNLENLAVTTDKLGNASVTSAKLADKSVTNAKLATKTLYGHSTFAAGHTNGAVQQLVVTFPVGSFTEIPCVVPAWSARGAGGVVSLVNHPYVVDTTKDNVTFGWLGDGVSSAAHTFDWIAVGA